MTVKIVDNIRTKCRQWVNEETYSKTKIIKRKANFFPVCERTRWLQRSSRGCWEVNWCMKIARKVAVFENTPLGCRRSIALRVSVKKIYSFDRVRRTHFGGVEGRKATSFYSEVESKPAGTINKHDILFEKLMFFITACPWFAVFNIRFNMSYTFFDGRIYPTDLLINWTVLDHYAKFRLVSINDWSKR